LQTADGCPSQIGVARTRMSASSISGGSGPPVAVALVGLHPNFTCSSTTRTTSPATSCSFTPQDHLAELSPLLEVVGAGLSVQFRTVRSGSIASGAPLAAVHTGEGHGGDTLSDLQPGPTPLRPRRAARRLHHLVTEQGITLYRPGEA